jgi:sugar/nucleoside kinase (ribokinase family)
VRILIAGELNVDLVLQNYQAFPQLGREVLVEDISLTLGSASAICAAGLAKLGDTVLFAGKLGCDPWGDLVMDILRGLGIDLTYVLRDGGIKTGITVSITSAKDRALVTYLGSIALLRSTDIPDACFEGCRHLHVSSFFLQQALRPGVKLLLARAHRAGLTTSIDPGYDPLGEWGCNPAGQGGGDLLDALEEADFFFPNAVEVAAVSGRPSPAEALRALENGRTTTIAKLGSDGCMTLVDGRPVRVPAFEVEPLDTTGSGDSFNAGFLHAWLGGHDLMESMRFATACGALSTLGLGGTAAQPTERQALNFLAGRCGESITAGCEPGDAGGPAAISTLR